MHKHINTLYGRMILKNIFQVPEFIEKYKLEIISSIEKAVKAGLDKYGQIDILSNTAGILDSYLPSL